MRTREVPARKLRQSTGRFRRRFELNPKASPNPDPYHTRFLLQPDRPSP